MRIKPGYGYWNLDGYPIGGSFKRSKGEVIASVDGEYSGKYGNGNVVTLDSGKRAAVSFDAIEFEAAQGR